MADVFCCSSKRIAFAVFDSVLGDDGKLKGGADGDFVRVGDVVGFSDLGVLVGVAVEEQADGGEGVAGFDGDGLGVAAAGADLVLQVRIAGIDFLDLIPDTLEDDF